MCHEYGTGMAVWRTEGTSHDDPPLMSLVEPIERLAVCSSPSNPLDTVLVQAGSVAGEELEILSNIPTVPQKYARLDSPGMNALPVDRADEPSFLTRRA